jgi:hypothetical protein
MKLAKARSRAEGAFLDAGPAKTSEPEKTSNALAQIKTRSPLRNGAMRITHLSRARPRGRIEMI